MPMNVARLNHAVLFVRDAERAADFYRRVFGFEVVDSLGGRAIFMRAAGGDNHHDLGLFSVGEAAGRPPQGTVGLYHLAWEVPTIEDLAEAEPALRGARALGRVRAQGGRCAARPRGRAAPLGSGEPSSQSGRYAGRLLTSSTSWGRPSTNEWSEPGRGRETEAGSR